MSIPNIDALAGAALERVQTCKAIRIAGNPGEVSSWDLVLFDERGVHLASQPFSFSGDFHEGGLNAIARLLDARGLVYGQPWRAIDDGYEATVAKKVSWL